MGALEDLGLAGSRSLLAVDFDAESVGGIGHGADEGVVSLCGELKDTVGNHVKLATGAQIVGLGNVKGDSDGLTGRDVLEGIVRGLGRVEAETDTVEVDILA